MRKLTRLQTIIAGSAVAVAGITAPIVATASHHGSTAKDSEHAATAAAASTTTAQANTTTSTPTDAELHPVKVTAKQVTLNPQLSTEQKNNAKAIVQAGQDLNLPPRAWEIAVATSLQESDLHNLGDLGAKNDHDSLGLFQQRTGTGGWGTADQIMDPHHAATMFYQRLQKVSDWDSMPLTKAAQKVQVSAYPQAYAKHESEAATIIKTVTG